MDCSMVLHKSSEETIQKAWKRGSTAGLITDLFHLFFSETFLHGHLKVSKFKKWNIICINLIIGYYFTCFHSFYQWLCCDFIFVAAVTTTAYALFEIQTTGMAAASEYFIMRWWCLDHQNQGTIVFAMNDKYPLKKPRPTTIDFTNDLIC